MGWEQERDVWIGNQIFLGAHRNWLSIGLTIDRAYFLCRILTAHSNFMPKYCTELPYREQKLEIHAQNRITLGAAVIRSIGIHTEGGANSFDWDPSSRSRI